MWFRNPLNRLILIIWVWSQSLIGLEKSVRGVNKRTITYTNRESNQHTSSAHSCKQNTITTTPLSLVFLSLSMIYDQFLWDKTFEIYQIRPSEKLLYHYMKVGHQSYTKSSSCHLPAFESGTVTTCDNLYDECDHILTNLVRQNIKKFEKKIVQH